MMSERMTASPASPSLELRRTREFTVLEKSNLTRLWGRLACNWRHIEDVLNDDHHNGGMFIVKSAFYGKDVAP
jgi:hypothetical protein